MRTLAAAIVVANLAVLLATRLAFDAWVRQRFGHLDLDMIGLSGVAWLPLVVIGVLVAVAAVWVRAARWAAAAVIGILAVIVADHAAGAVRDGSVSGPGALTGGLMVVQLVTLGISVLAAGSPTRHQSATRRRAID
jgi:hypothetical protein